MIDQGKIVIIFSPPYVKDLKEIYHPDISLSRNGAFRQNDSSKNPWIVLVLNEQYAGSAHGAAGN